MNFRNTAFGAYVSVGRLLSSLFAPKNVPLFDFQNRLGRYIDELTSDNQPFTVVWADSLSEQYGAVAYLRLQSRVAATHGRISGLPEYALEGSNVLGVIYAPNNESVGKIKHGVDGIRESHAVRDFYILQAEPFRLSREVNGNGKKGAEAE